MTKKKIVFVIESLHLGGAEKSLVTLLNNVDFSNYEVELWLNALGGILEKQIPNFVTIKKIPRRNPYFLERIYFYLLKKVLPLSNYNSSQIIWRAFRGTYYKSTAYFDIAISYHQGLPAYYIVEKLNAGKKISWLNTDYKLAGYNIKTDNKIFDELDIIVAASNYAGKTLESSYEPGKFSNKLEVLEDLIDYEDILQKAKEPCELEQDRQFKILTVGRLNPTKGYHLAIKAAKILKEQELDFKWYIIGEGSERMMIENLIKKFQLEKNVILLGAQSNPYKYIRNADLYVQTSILEGYSISVREAKVLHKPIVCTNFPSILDAIEDGVNGFIVEQNERDIAEKIMKTYQQPEIRSFFSDNLKKENFANKEVYKQKFHSILEKLAQ